MSNNKEIDNIRLELLKEFGANAIIKGEDLEKAKYGRISTGSIALDLALGGGVPIGRATQISGAKSSGKSSTCDHIAKNAQATSVHWEWTERKAEKGREVVTPKDIAVEGLTVAYLDLEGTKTIDWSRDCIGVDTDSWLYAQPSGAEEALEMAHSMQKKGVNVIFIDSVDSLIPVKAYETELGESVQMGIKQKLIGDYLKKYTATNNKLAREGKLPCTLILINQLREKIGAYGDSEYTVGGRAIEYYISVDLRLRRGDWLVEGKGENKQIVGQVIKFKTHKNKTYKQQQTGSFDFYFDDTLDGHKMGEIDVFKDIVMEAIAWGVIERAGAWFKYKGQNIAQGAQNTADYLKENNELFTQIRDELFTIIKVDAKEQDI